MRVTVPRLTRARAVLGGLGEPSDVVAARVAAARRLQVERYRYQPWSLNSAAPGRYLRGPDAVIDTDVRRLLERSVEKGTLTMRGLDRVLRIARTLADLSGADRPDLALVGQALCLRTGGDDAPAL